jgi:hypothetical protein
VDNTIAVADLDAAWTSAVSQRRVCRCGVCRLASDTRAWVDARMAEIAAMQPLGGVGSVGLNTLAQAVTEPKLGITYAHLKAHRDKCGVNRCGVYDGPADDLGA